MRLAAVAALVGLSLLGAWSAPVPASTAADLCVECHLSYRPRDLGALAWRGPVQGDALSLCPAVNRARRELFLTESRLFSLAAWADRLRARRINTGPLERELTRSLMAYHAALARPADSISELTARLGRIRRDLDRRVRRPLQALEGGRDRGLAWALAIIIALGLALAALVGFKRRLNPRGPDPLLWVREGRLPEARPQTGPEGEGP